MDGPLAKQTLMKIKEFPLLFQVEGLRIIEQLLCSRGSLIEDRIEAAGVLAQITSPWISDNHKINHLDNFVYNMVNALTGMFPLYNISQGNKHSIGSSIYSRGHNSTYPYLINPK